MIILAVSPRQKSLFDQLLAGEYRIDSTAFDGSDGDVEYDESVDGALVDITDGEFEFEYIRGPHMNRQYPWGGGTPQWGDWTLPGRGNPSRDSCDEPNIIFVAESESKGIPVVDYCYQPQCPKCSHKWATRQGQRSGEAFWKKAEALGHKLEHWVYSPEKTTFNVGDVDGIRAYFRQLLKIIDPDNQLLILYSIHPARWKKSLSQWVWSPHIHFIISQNSVLNDTTTKRLFDEYGWLLRNLSLDRATKVNAIIAQKIDSGDPDVSVQDLVAPYIENFVNLQACLAYIFSHAAVYISTKKAGHICRSIHRAANCYWRRENIREVRENVTYKCEPFVKYGARIISTNHFTKRIKIWNGREVDRIHTRCKCGVGAPFKDFKQQFVTMKRVTTEYDIVYTGIHRKVRPKENGDCNWVKRKKLPADILPLTPREQYRKILKKLILDVDNWLIEVVNKYAEDL